MLNFKDKKVLVMGLGAHEEGSGISAVRYLLPQGAKITVTDLKTREQLAEQIKRLGKSAKKVKFVLGEHREADFKSADMVVRNPGVPKNSKFLQIARDNNIPIETDISIFFQLVDRKRIIGITGTRGKSTTTTLIHEFIKTVDGNAVLGGNITKSPLGQMSLVKRGGTIVLELSSWMLEGLAGIKKSPHIAVFTNIYPDHLNTYEDINDYAAAKKNIFAWQNGQDCAILNRDNKFTRAMGKEVPSQRFWTSLKKFTVENGCFIANGKIIFRRGGKEQIICSIKDVKLLGEHNLANVLVAVCAGMIYGVKPSAICAVLKKFKGIPNRLELLREVGGVKYYNDTTSTMPEAAMAALRALKHSPPYRGGVRGGGIVGNFINPSVASRHLPLKRGEKNIILIAGGSDKGLDFSELAKEIQKHCKGLVLLNGTGTVRLENKIGNWKLEIGNLIKVNSMIDAVGLAKSLSKKGDIILLSPACASFGMFRNEFDRGDQYRKAISKLK